EVIEQDCCSLHLLTAASGTTRPCWPPANWSAHWGSAADRAPTNNCAQHCRRQTRWVAAHRAPNRRAEICRNDPFRSQRAQPAHGVREPLQADGESGSSDIVPLATIVSSRLSAPRSGPDEHLRLASRQSPRACFCMPDRIVGNRAQFRARLIFPPDRFDLEPLCL